MYVYICMYRCMNLRFRGCVYRVSYVCWKKKLLLDDDDDDDEDPMVLL